MFSTHRVSPRTKASNALLRRHAQPQRRDRECGRDHLARHHIDHGQVVCALLAEGTFRDVILRTVAPPRYEGDTLGEIIDDEVRFRFDSRAG